MKNFVLTSDEICELKAAHRVASNKKLVKYAYKINAIILLGTEWTAEEVSEALLLDKNTLGTYVKNYKIGGIDCLLQTAYKGRVPRLDTTQQQELTNHLAEYTYPDAKAVAKYIKETYKVSYSISGATDLLRKFGFTYKKPKNTPPGADAIDQIQHLEKYEKARREGAEVYFMDGCHPHYNSRPDYGWVLKGHEKALISNSGKKKINIQGAVNIESKQIIGNVSEENINQNTALKFIEKVHTKHEKEEKVLIVLDNAGYYKSNKVKSYVEKHENLELLFLPPYCPHLNLIERVWKYFYKQVISNRHYENFKGFVAGCKSFFRRSHRKKFSTLLTEKFHFGREKTTVLKTSFMLA